MVSGNYFLIKHIIVLWFLFLLLRLKFDKNFGIFSQLVSFSSFRFVCIFGLVFLSIFLQIFKYLSSVLLNIPIHPPNQIINLNFIPNHLFNKQLSIGKPPNLFNKFPNWLSSLHIYSKIYHQVWINHHRSAHNSTHSLIIIFIVTFQFIYT